MAREQDLSMRKHKCQGCYATFMTYLEGELGSFCPICRADWGLTSDEEAAEMLQCIDLGIIVPEIDVEDIKKKGRNVKMFPMNDAAKKEVPINREAVLEGMRALVDHKVAPLTEGYTKSITYVTAKNGLFEVRHSDLATIVCKPKEVLGITEEWKEGITLNIPKVPYNYLMQTISFFRGVCVKQKGPSEAIIQVWWDRAKKEHVLHVPEQQVSGGGVRHQSNFDQEAGGNYLHVMDIHSHGSMGAFWSGIDDADEKRVSTERLFGVIGKVQSPIPEWKWRMRTRDGFIDFNIAEVFDIPKTEVDFKVSTEAIFRSLGDPTSYKDGRVVLNCPVDPFSNVDVPEEWYDKVKGYTFSSGAGYGPYGSASRGGGEQNRLPGFMKGYIYVSGIEYEVDGATIKPTGQRLLKKGEELNGKR